MIVVPVVDPNGRRDDESATARKRIGDSERAHAPQRPEECKLVEHRNLGRIRLGEEL